MEHRHHQHDHVVLGDREGVGGALGERVDEGRAVPVGDAARIAGGAAGVTDRGGRGLVERLPRRHRAGLGEDLLDRDRALAEGGAVAADDDEALDRRQLVGEGGEQVDQQLVDEEEAIFGVVDDEGDLVGEEPDVHRVQHRAHAGDGEVGGEVVGVVPAEGADDVAVADPEPFEADGQSVGALGDLGVGEGRARAVGGVSGDEAARVDGATVVIDQPRGQRHRRHRALHLRLSPLVPWSGRSPGGGGPKTKVARHVEPGSRSSRSRRGEIGDIDKAPTSLPGRPNSHVLGSRCQLRGGTRWAILRGDSSARRDDPPARANTPGCPCRVPSARTRGMQHRPRRLWRRQ